MLNKYRKPQINTVGLVAYYKLWSGLYDGTNIFDYALNSFMGVPTQSGAAYPGLVFDGASDQIDFASGPSSVSTIIMWLKPTAVTAEEVIDLNNTDFIEIGAGDIIKSGFAGGTAIVYIDGVATTTIGTTWQMFTITDTVGKDASAGNMTIGVTDTAADFFDGMIGEAMLYDRVLTPAEIKSIYELTKWRYPNN